MKKKLTAAVIVAALIAGLFFAWRIGYFLRKSNDNLPPLTKIAEMEEADVNSLLMGYKIAQLREVWGAPDRSEENEDVWQIGDVTLTVNYKNNGTVVVCGLKTGQNVGGADILAEIPGAVVHLVEIWDRTKEEDLDCDDAFELFYEDDRADYYFNCVKSQYVIAMDSTGRTMDIVTALNEGLATISDLDRFGISYIIAIE